MKKKSPPESANGADRVYDSAPIGLCYFDADLRFRYVNPWLARINGLPVEAHLGKTIRQLLHDVAAGVEPQLRRVLETGEPIIEGEVEAETPAHPGELRHYMHNYYPDKSKDGTVVGVSCVVQDITHRINLEREVVAAGERERQRIGRELHDSVGQGLAGVSLVLQAFSRGLACEQSPDVQSLRELTGTVDNMIVDIQSFVSLLTPVFSDELGLSAALRALAKDVNQHSDVDLYARCSYENDIHDTELATNIYRIAQESVTNAIRHSGAKNIELLCGHDGDSVFLEVLDDGTGIPAKENRVEGIGLKSMHYRARMLRGRLDVGLRTNGGTRVLFSCPVQPRSLSKGPPTW
ncbi:MAG: PAS domain S-box protein [Gammaproteobacteria bacterium]|nr:MAG: PAS domain S-box protein [Gammaproteobacteria bacterium]